MRHAIRRNYTGRDGEVRDIPDPTHDDEACERAIWFHARELYAHLTGRGYPPELPSADMGAQAEAAALCAALAVLVEHVILAIEDEEHLKALSDRGARDVRAAEQTAQIDRGNLIAGAFAKAIEAETRIPAELWPILSGYLDDVGPAVVTVIQGHRARQRAAEAEAEART